VRVVIDTNVLVSGLASVEGNCFEILEWLRAGRLEACYNAAILAEYDEVLQRPKFGFDPADIDGLLELIEREGWAIVAEPLKMLKDPTDTKFLEVAVSGNCEHLVTGNLKDFPKDRYGTVSIVSPAEFLKRYRG
jgi:putative PIN family toxin of toxin-antitoxin system